MGKRDIKIDYGLIDDILLELKKYSDGLEEMQSAVEKINRTIHTSSDADSVRQLEKRYNKVKKRLDDSHGEVDALYNLLNSYRKDMTAIIKPKKGMTRVGRNDIYCNLKSVKMAVRDVIEVKKDVPLITDMGMDCTDAEKQAMTENYGKLEQQVWNSILSELNAEMEKSKKKLEGYYKEKVVEYENMDDDYRLKAEKVRVKYASTWDHMKQAYANHTGEQKQIAKGALRAVTDFVKGLVFIDKIVYYANTGSAAAAIACLSPQPPEWTEKMLGESQEYFGPIAEALTHPVDAIKAMAQDTSDTYETEGLVYTGAYVIADIMIGKAVTSGISKATGTGAGAVDEIGDVANKADDVADVAETAGKMDDVVDAAKTAEKTGDVAEMAGKGGKTISLADYDSIYQKSIFNADKDMVMLGKYDGGGATSYITKAGDDYTYFSLGSDWDTIKNIYGYTDNDMFKLFNEAFLDDGINAKKTFKFSHDPRFDTGALGQELKYLEQNGYVYDVGSMSASFDESLIGINGLAQ